MICIKMLTFYFKLIPLTDIHIFIAHCNIGMYEVSTILESWWQTNQLSRAIRKGVSRQSC